MTTVCTPTRSGLIYMSATTTSAAQSSDPSHYQNRKSPLDLNFFLTQELDNLISVSNGQNSQAFVQMKLTFAENIFIPRESSEAILGETENNK